MKIKKNILTTSAFSPH